MSLGHFHLNAALLKAVHKLLVVLSEFEPLHLIEMVTFTDVCHEHSPHVPDRVQVKTLGKLFQNLHSSLIEPFLYQF